MARHPTMTVERARATGAYRRNPARFRLREAAVQAPPLGPASDFLPPAAATLWPVFDRGLYEPHRAWCEAMCLMQALFDAGRLSKRGKVTYERLLKQGGIL